MTHCNSDMQDCKDSLKADVMIILNDVWDTREKINKAIDECFNELEGCMPLYDDDHSYDFTGE